MDYRKGEEKGNRDGIIRAIETYVYIAHRAFSECGPRLVRNSLSLKRAHAYRGSGLCNSGLRGELANKREVVSK